LLLHRPFNSEKAAYLRLVKRGSVVLEIGANLGYFTRLFSHLVGPRGKVVAFEPIPQTRKTLLQNVQTLGAGNVCILPFAIAEQAGEATMFVPGRIHGQASLQRHSEGGWGTGETVETVIVECMPLDRVGEVAALPRVDFIKVDAEGAELPVLKGARQLLLRDHPLLHLEIEPTWMRAFNYSPEDLESYLRGLGYRYFTSYCKDWQPLENLGSLDGGFNVVCSADNMASVM
jgi:FkbM family methyltransferase